MANLNFITSQLATGGDLPHDRTVEALDEWRRLGITHVVDNRLEWSDVEFVASQAPEIRYLHNGVDDAGQRMPDAWFETGVGFVRSAIEVSGHKVLVHCHMGINRGPSLAYATLLALGWDLVEAIDAIRTARPIAGVGYAEDALDWHHRLHGTPLSRRHADCSRLEAWRAANQIDVRRIIRTIRAAQAS